MKNIIDNGLESWQRSFKTKTILVCLVASIVAVLGFYFHFDKKLYEREKQFVEKVNNQNVCFRDSLQYFVDTSLVYVSRVVDKGKK